MEGIGAGIILAIALVAILEVCRFFRRSSSISREIDELKVRLSNIEELLNNQGK